MAMITILSGARKSLLLLLMSRKDLTRALPSVVHMSGSQDLLEWGQNRATILEMDVDASLMPTLCQTPIPFRKMGLRNRKWELLLGWSIVHMVVALTMNATRIW